MKKLNKLLILYVYINWKVVNIRNVLLAWLLVYCCTSWLRILYLSFGYFTIKGEGVQTLELYSARTASEQGGIFILPHLL